MERSLYFVIRLNLDFSILNLTLLFFSSTPVIIKIVLLRRVIIAVRNTDNVNITNGKRNDIITAVSSSPYLTGSGSSFMKHIGIKIFSIGMLSITPATLPNMDTIIPITL